MAKSVGIDLGTTNSVVAGQATVIIAKPRRTQAVGVTK
jgi:molecular chaperone DnaK (HSP70)